MRQKIQGFIFDLDGVIVSTSKNHFQAWNRIAQELGGELNPDLEYKMRGLSREDSLILVLTMIGKSISSDERATILIRKNEYYKKSIQNIGEEEMILGVLDFLQKLKADNKKLAIASSSKNARSVIDLLGLNDKFDFIFGGHDFVKGKPDPEIFYKAANALQYKPSECVIFEDSPKGIQAGKVGGFWTVGIGEKNVLSDANLVIPNFEGINYQNILSQLELINQQLKL